MSLVACKEFEAQVSESATICPKCGVGEPGVRFGTVVFSRTPAFAGSMSALKVFVNNQQVGELRNGDSVVLKLSPGKHDIQLRGGLLSRATTISVHEGETTRYRTYFYSGLFSGGIKLELG
ncbi:MAG: DUF2846 domain-containing protein [SAR202 cluster bacterium]|nr:DUF2846 domain-containing protein [SAR202 cluster bacterium]